MLHGEESLLVLLDGIEFSCLQEAWPHGEKDFGDRHRGDGEKRLHLRIELEQFRFRYFVHNGVASHDVSF